MERDAAAIAPTPRVFLFAVDRLVGISDAAIARFGRCPAWYLRKENDERSKLFTRLPEPPVEGPEVDEVLAALSAGIRDAGTAVMTLVGRTPTMSLGFHTAATFERYASGRVAAVPSGSLNLKITFPDDVGLAERL